MKTLGLISLILIILLMRQLVNIFPSLRACLIRWKENINLESSVKLSRDRDILTLAFIIPFCMTVNRFGLYELKFMKGMGEFASFGVVFGIFFLYVTLRILLTKILRPKRNNKRMYAIADKCANSYFIILTLLLLLTAGLLGFFDVPIEGIHDAMLWISGATYLLYSIRKLQIFLSSYSIFTAFLYLCALDFIPTGALVASAAFFR